MRNSLGIAYGITIAIACSDAIADPAANAFANIFATTCMKHASDVKQLQTKLDQVPKLLPDQAKPFLQGRAGSAWPVPDKSGHFVVAIPEGTNLCAVYARRADAESVAKQVTALISTAPAPLRAVQRTDTRSHSPKNGSMRTIAYEWSVPDATRKLVFTLTTATGEAADLQAMASAALTQ
jgi:hypothetical protein